METLTNLPKALLTEILARLSMRSISGFKSVRKEWKTTLSSVYFCRPFLSVHQNSSPSWSLIRGRFMAKEFISSYGCQTWNLPKSPHSYFPRPCNYDLAYSCSSNGLVMLKVLGSASFVGNPVLQKWVKIPKAPYESREFCLVTRVDVDGVVLSFKIVEFGVERFSTCLNVHIYSSETGIWTPKQLQLQCHTTYSFTSFPISLIGTLYILSQSMIVFPEPGGVLIAHDFYSETDQCQIIHFLNQCKNFNDEYYKVDLTTSGGFLLYMDTFPGKTNNILKIWKLNNDSAWQVLWEIDLSFIWSDIGHCIPIAMHPFESDIVYLIVRINQKRSLVSYNLVTQKYRILRNASNSEDDIMEYARLPIFDTSVFLYQFVLARSMDSIPCPPQTEIIGTTSLFPSTFSMSKRD